MVSPPSAAAGTAVLPVVSGRTAGTGGRMSGSGPSGPSDPSSAVVTVIWLASDRRSWRRLSQPWSVSSPGDEEPGEEEVGERSGPAGGRAASRVAMAATLVIA